MAEILWKPSKEKAAASNMQHFINFINNKHQTQFQNYQDLYIWSITYPEEFWINLWDFCEIKSKHLWEHALLNRSPMANAKWFTGATLNFAENLLRDNNDKTAIVFTNEKQQRRTFTYQEIASAVNSLAAALKQLGIKPKDRIVGFLPNIPEAIIVMLAATQIGAIWSACSPDFGTDAVLDRFGQIEPSILFTIDGHFYNGKTYDDLPKIRKISAHLPSLKKIIVIPYTKKQINIKKIKHAQQYKTFIKSAKKNHNNNYPQFPFDHPVYILYSSGTTGKPKCIVHGAGGTLLQHLKELVLHTNLIENDKIFYYTTTGWMMWNWVVSSLAVNATLILYDGSPLYPQPQFLFDLIDKEKITIFGTSAKYLAAIEKSGIEPIKTHDLDSLQTILSTGSPLLPENFTYVYEKIKTDVQLSSISGGTDIISCFALGNPLLPVYKGELQSIGLGMKVEIFNNKGESVIQEKGELVCTEPFPSMPIYFWNDPNNKKYYAAYFEKFPGIWAHGDYAEITEHRTMIISGRSDATLKPHGIRLGTAEIYREVEKFPEVVEAIVVGQEWYQDIRVILFIKLRESERLTEKLKTKINKAIKEQISPHHVPAKIIQVPDIPRTISGKIVELAVREVIHNRPVKNIEALANPEALEYYKNLPELND